MALTGILGIMCGLPLSGKTTHARQLREFANWTVICPDDVRASLHGQSFVPNAEWVVWGMCETVARALLASEHAVLIDATNITAKRRRRWVEIAEECGVPVHAWVLGTEPEECKRRAITRGDDHMVRVIDRMANEWEPIHGEGITAVTYVGG